jgi:hypothetical protein
MLVGKVYLQLVSRWSQKYECQKLHSPKIVWIAHGNSTLTSVVCWGTDWVYIEIINLEWNVHSLSVSLSDSVCIYIPNTSILSWKPSTVCCNIHLMYFYCWSQWPHGVRHGHSAECLLGSWVQISLETWMFVSCECLCVVRYRSLQQTDHCTRRVLLCVMCLTECHIETSERRQPRPNFGCCAAGKEYFYHLSFERSWYYIFFIYLQMCCQLCMVWVLPVGVLVVHCSFG